MNTCDHLIGYFEPHGLPFTEKVRSSENISKPLDVKFNFCPDCGERLESLWSK